MVEGVVRGQPRWPRWALGAFAAVVLAAVAVLVTGIDERGAERTPSATTGITVPAVIRPGELLATRAALAAPIDLQIHVAANGTDGAPSGLYRVDLTTGAIRLLVARAWSTGDQLLSFGYGAVIFDARRGALTVVTKAGQTYELPGGSVDAVTADIDGIHLWTATGRVDGVFLQRHRVDGGGVDHEFVLAHGVRLLRVGSDGWPLLAGPTGGTFALDPADGALSRASEGLIAGIGWSGVVELICDDQLDCALRWRGRSDGERFVLSGDPSAVPSVSTDGVGAVVVTQRGADITDLRTGERFGVSLLAGAPEATDAPVVAPSSPVWSADSRSAVFAFGGLLYLHRRGESSIGPTGLNEQLGAVLAVTAGSR